MIELGLPINAVFVAGAAGVTALAFLARHERNVLRARRELMLEPVRALFTGASYSTDGAGIPRIEGTYSRHRIRVDLIPDTMTIRRLPQLWVSVTALKALTAPDAGVAILVRPSGNDFYSLTERMDLHIDTPQSFPLDCLVRGQGPASRTTLQRVAPAVAGILADAKVKEIALTDRGARIVYQLAEGRRGQHLILRQSDFDEARLEPHLLDRLIEDLDQVGQALGVSLEIPE